MRGQDRERENRAQRVSNGRLAPAAPCANVPPTRRPAAGQRVRSSAWPTQPRPTKEGGPRHGAPLEETEGELVSKRLVFLLCAALACAVLVAACGGDDSSESAGSSTTETGATAGVK